MSKEILDPNSQQVADNKSHKLWSWLIAAIVIAAHILIPLLSDNPFASIKAHTAWVLIPVALVVYLIVLIPALLRDASWCTEKNAGWAGLVILGGASLVIFGWCISC